MAKKVITLVVISSLISAGLLYLGFTMLSQYTPAFASGSNALFVKTSGQDAIAPASAESGSPSSKELSSEKSDRGIASSLPMASSSPVITIQSQSSTESTSSGVTPITGKTIAELLKNTVLHDDVIVTIAGIASILDEERFILNDGTGQIMVEVEDELLTSLKIDGLSVTVTGEFELSSDSTLPKLEASSLTFQGQTIVFDDRLDDDDDVDDDMDDDANDDDDDDMDDDMDDDADDDDDMDDDEDDGIGDDSGENSGSGSSSDSVEGNK